MRLSGEENNLPNDVPEYLKSKEQLTPFEKLMPILLAVALSYIFVR